MRDKWRVILAAFSVSTSVLKIMASRIVQRPNFEISLLLLPHCILKPPRSTRKPSNFLHGDVSLTRGVKFDWHNIYA